MIGNRIELPPEALFSLSFQNENAVERDKFLSLMENYKENILRLKGNINFENGPMFVEVIHGKYEEKELLGMENYRAGISIIAWKTEKEKLKETFESLWKNS